MLFSDFSDESSDSESPKKQKINHSESIAGSDYNYDESYGDVIRGYEKTRTKKTTLYTNGKLISDIKITSVFIPNKL